MASAISHNFLLLGGEVEAILERDRAWIKMGSFHEGKRDGNYFV